MVARDIVVEEREVIEHKIEWREPCYCPLVTVGDYVLTGWGARETDVETARQFYGWLYALAVALVALAAISMGLARLGSPLWGYAAPLAATLSLVAFVEACRKRGIAREETVGIGQLSASRPVVVPVLIGSHDIVGSRGNGQLDFRGGRRAAERCRHRAAAAQLFAGQRTRSSQDRKASDGKRFTKSGNAGDRQGSAGEEECLVCGAFWPCQLRRLWECIRVSQPGSEDRGAGSDYSL